MLHIIGTIHTITIAAEFPISKTVAVPVTINNIKIQSSKGASFLSTCKQGCIQLTV